ncbi:hypothetical protein Gotri_009862 [Gossypium trilobum]|uniref:Uncharacterized protein n=1 Tax=Gossypium trilobum TaxID=34281 RepID=A0A7J9ENQ4_9ROSI|nr:hypothetical protein [Gossypium trilobum]
MEDSLLCAEMDIEEGCHRDSVYTLHWLDVDVEPLYRYPSVVFGSMIVF